MMNHYTVHLCNTYITLFTNYASIFKKCPLLSHLSVCSGKSVCPVSGPVTSERIFTSQQTVTLASFKREKKEINLHLCRGPRSKLLSLKGVGNASPHYS